MAAHLAWPYKDALFQTAHQGPDQLLVLDCPLDIGYHMLHPVWLQMGDGWLRCQLPDRLLLWQAEPSSLQDGLQDCLHPRGCQVDVSHVDVCSRF